MLDRDVTGDHSSRVFDPLSHPATRQLRTGDHSESTKLHSMSIIRLRLWLTHCQLECGPMPNVMVALLNIGGALCSTLQNLADAHY